MVSATSSKILRLEACRKQRNNVRQDWESGLPILADVVPYPARCPDGSDFAQREEIVHSSAEGNPHARLF